MAVRLCLCEFMRVHVFVATHVCMSMSALPQSLSALFLGGWGAESLTESEAHQCGWTGLPGELLAFTHLHSQPTEHVSPHA